MTERIQSDLLKKATQLYGRDIIEKICTHPHFSLEYGVPIPSIPYILIGIIEENLDASNPLESCNKAYDMVEKEKENGKPGAFVLEAFKPELKIYVYEVWSWAN